MKSWPQISIIIVSLNAERTIQQCLQYIKDQTYTKISEILLVDGGSTDSTFSIAKKIKLPVKIIHAHYKNNQEARRAIGVKQAKNEICVFIDTDNFILDKDWLKKMIQPLVENKDVIASQTLRYAAPKNTTLFNRYFGLLGASDPVAYYLGKDDRLSWAFKKWNLLGKIVSENKDYLIIDFDPENYPTLGCNGVVFRRSVLLKSKWKSPKEYIHTDVFVDVGKLGYTKFAIVKNEIFHNTADNIFNFLSKRRKYMKFYHQVLNKKRRHLTFDLKRKKDIIRLLLFVLYTTTLIEPIGESIRGYRRKNDIAWFIHPLVCWIIMLVYAESTIRTKLKKI